MDIAGGPQVQHAAPARGWGLNAETEKTEGGLHQDHARNLKCGNDDDDVCDVVVVASDRELRAVVVVDLDETPDAQQQ